MIEWGAILYGAALVGAVHGRSPDAVTRRRADVITVAALCALLAPIGWNAILRATHAEEFFTDLPVAVFPASWQDFGSGVFTLALASLAIGVVLPPRPPGRR